MFLRRNGTLVLNTRLQIVWHIFLRTRIQTMSCSSVSVRVLSSVAYLKDAEQREGR